VADSGAAAAAKPRKPRTFPSHPKRLRSLPRAWERGFAVRAVLITRGASSPNWPPSTPVSTSPERRGLAFCADCYGLPGTDRRRRRPPVESPPCAATGRPPDPHLSNRT
jgi:hypothetical protein